jgi:hypothetical protein
MRHKVLWNLLVALFVCGLLLPGLSALAADEVPESESGIVMPGEAEGFNPRPELPAAESGPGLKQPIREKGMEPGDDERIVQPPDKRAAELPDSGRN